MLNGNVAVRECSGGDFFCGVEITSLARRDRPVFLNLQAPFQAEGNRPLFFIFVA